jgi:hypothetical protein
MGSITTRAMIAEWLEEAKLKGATHMIVVCDTFDYRDYPVFVLCETDVRDEIKKYQNSEQMSRVMEVYDLGMPLNEQLSERRAWHS